jgi:DNA mismatch repair ATPase MutS
LLNLFLGRHSAELTKRLPQWLDVWYQLDGLSALADFAWLHSNYSFPRITEHHKEDRNILSAVQIGHPLIDEEIRVKNDFRIDKDRGIALITGSNMSGKSTFLRTIGINIVLAYAGAPVCASQFSLKLLKLLTCINISDSLGEGISYFYAEVKRLKLIIEQQKTVFFLIDEIYRGTNNRERLIGSRAIIKRLAEKKNFGIISTHDLELTAMEKEILFLRNFHFRDTISNGKMIFDYKLHDGPCPTTNALKIMEAEGLPI